MFVDPVCPTHGCELTGFSTLFCPKCEAEPELESESKLGYLVTKESFMAPLLNYGAIHFSIQSLMAHLRAWCDYVADNPSVPFGPTRVYLWTLPVSNADAITLCPSLEGHNKAIPLQDGVYINYRTKVDSSNAEQIGEVQFLYAGNTGRRFPMCRFWAKQAS